jgi:hypothetical protein
MDLGEQLDSAKSSLFRFEGLQTYDPTKKEEAFQKFLQTGVRDLSGMQEWWDFIRSKTSSGVVMQRVRLVTFPLTDYTRFELPAHARSVEQGDDIRIITEPVFSSLGINVKDFWMVDEAVVLRMQYDNGGLYLGCELEHNVEPYIHAKQHLLEHSVLLKDFIGELNLK